MTLAELEDTLPNGFHDAMIYALSVDYKDQTVALDVDLSFAGPDDPPDVPDYRRAVIKVSGLKILVIDPPNPGPLYGVLDGDELFTKGFVTEADEYWKKRLDPKLIEAAGADAPLYSFFVHGWNSCIHIAATDAVCNWKNESTTSTTVH